MQCRNYTN